MWPKTMHPYDQDDNRKYREGTWVPPGLAKQRKLRKRPEIEIKRCIEDKERKRLQYAADYKSNGEFIVLLRDVLGLDPCADRFGVG